ncbi:ABC transporter permease [Aestuariivirga sp.]|uniref:ABC transporter permease n=1 Tax=Aestuariivirga sp. TaxID=2650926 RepID=UPI00391D9847
MAWKAVNQGLWNAFGLAVALFLLSPLVLVVLFSFGQNELATLPIDGLTLRWYAVLFENANFWSALENSLIVTGVTGIVSTMTGTLAAFALARCADRSADTLMTLLSLPVMLPPLVLALGLATLFSTLGWHLGLHTVIPSHLVFTQPFVILIVYARMERFDFNVLDSARDLGASPLYSFATVTLPLTRPTLIGAALIAMSVSLDDFVITFFTIGNGMTLPTLVWGMLRTSLDPSINALGTLILVTTITASVVALNLTRYRG